LKLKLLLILLIFILISCSESLREPDMDPLPWVTDRVTAPNTDRVIFFSESTGSNVSFHIFLPDAYQANTLQRFPVIYWLHGGGGGADGILPLTTQFRNAMARGKIPPAIIVFPNGLPHGMWCDSKDGRQPVESMFIRDLIPYVDANYRTIARRSGRIAEGFSMGGYGAARFGFRYRELFGGISLLGAGPLQLDFSVVAPGNQLLQQRIFREVYGSDMAYFEAQSPWRLAETYGSLLPDPTPLRIVVGMAEYVYENNVIFSGHLTSLGISHDFFAFENVGHSVPEYFTSLGDDNWDFYRSVFNSDADL
jgi:S-formylglutathione hydrolase FrmB